MRRSGLLLMAVVLVALLTGCASKEFTVNYSPQEQGRDALVGVPAVLVVAKDERAQREIAAAVKPTSGDHAAGVALFSPLYLMLDTDMEQSKTQDFVDEFRKAIEGRIVSGGGKVSADSSQRVVEIAVRNIDLGIDSGFWKARVAYVATVSEGGKSVFGQSVDESAEAYNWWGESSGQKALNEAFTSAINALDLNRCLSHLGQKP